MFIIHAFVARNEELGLKVVNSRINNEVQDKRRFHQLDITNVESIRRFVDHIKKNMEV
jgi:hypothetical protein